MKWRGLSDQEAKEGKKKYGDNSLPEREPLIWTRILINQFKSPLIYILLAVITISLILKEINDAILVSAVVILNVIMGFVQEFGAQKTLKSLKNIVHDTVTIIRNDQRAILETIDLVPEDIVLLGSGDKVPADCEVVEGSVLVSEAILTGEEEPVSKNEAGSKELFMGTIILSGRCTAIVKKIGTKTEIGQIGQSLSEIKERETPLQRRLEKFSGSLAILVVFIGLIIFIIGILSHHNIIEMLTFSIILSIAVIPEGLPIAVTVILSIGMKRVLRQKGLVKKLISIETLGSTSVICTDKTGTLTEGVMKVVRVETDDQKKLLYGLNILNSQRTSLEIAIWKYLKENINVDPQVVLDKAKILYEETFESEKKFALCIVQTDNTKESFILGAPEIIINFCKITPAEKQKITDKFQKWTKEGNRVVGLIHKNSVDKEKSGYSWLGLLGIEDPIRPGVKEAIEKAFNAGIKVKIVTGDYKNTAVKVAESIGIQVSDDSVMDGEQLDKISSENLRELIDKINLFCRVSPHQKLKIITALQANGEVVAMTGDGVNDAQAIKKADIGVVVGTATDVAKDSADLILLDNNFKTIVAACEEGRIIYQNIVKVVGYVLSNSLVEIVLIVGALIMDIPFPLTVVQILWLHLICDGPPDIALGFEPGDPEIMKDKPNKNNGNILGWPMVFLIFAISLTAGIASLVLFNKELFGGNIDHARTMVFAIVGSIDLIYIFAYKDLSKTILKLRRLLDNKYLILSVVYGFALLLFGIYSPLGNRVLNTTPLELTAWLIIIGVALITTLWVEVVKRFKKFT